MPNKDVPGKIVIKQNKIHLGDVSEESSKNKGTRPTSRKTTIRIDREMDNIMFEIDHALRGAGLTLPPTTQSKFSTGILLYKLAVDCIDKDRLIGKNEKEAEKEIYRFCKEKLTF